MGRFLNYHQTTTLNYGSEFRPLGDLKTILGGHPNFPLFRTLHENGMDYKFRRELSEKERIEELQANLTGGNHRSATESAEDVTRL